MTAFKDLLNDEELAAVLTFVRNTWGNSGSTISPDSVRRVRQETSKRTTFWKPDDLLAEHPLEAELMLADIGLDEQGFSNKELEDELLVTPSAKLAEIAMAKGDFERGKTLFYKSAAACATCHDPGANKVRIGPDLTKLTTVLAPEELVDSVLRPSKRIDKNYANVNVVTSKGEQLTGLRVSEDDKMLVLRNLAEPNPIQILQEDIEDIEDSRTSLMPANLARTLKNRQEFDDLIKYVLETRKRSAKN
jgi:putative heme-binding domain-containing protein